MTSYSRNFDDDDVNYSFKRNEEDNVYTTNFDHEHSNVLEREHSEVSDGENKDGLIFVEGPQDDLEEPVDSQQEEIEETVDEQQDNTEELVDNEHDELQNHQQNESEELSDYSNLKNNLQNSNRLVENNDNEVNLDSINQIPESEVLGEDDLESNISEDDNKDINQNDYQCLNSQSKLAEIHQESTKVLESEVEENVKPKDEKICENIVENNEPQVAKLKPLEKELVQPNVESSEYSPPSSISENDWAKRNQGRNRVVDLIARFTNAAKDPSLISNASTVYKTELDIPRTGPLRQSKFQ